MPLLRGLTVRLFDNYVGHNLTSIVRNDFQSQFDLNELGNTFPATNVNVHVPAGFVFGLEDEDCIVGLSKSSPNTLSTVTGHIYDFSTFNATNCVLFDSSRNFSGHLIDTANDSLTMPSEDGEFSISFWVNPYSAPSGIYDILSKKITSSSFHRFLLRYDSTGTSSVISFSAASETGTSEESVEAGIVAGRWSLVTAKCSNKTIRLSVRGADGFVSKEKLTSNVRLGCLSTGGSLYCGIGSDGVSNPLHAGSFYLQQVCFWNKEITEHEETELFNLGRGKTRFSDPAVPETFANFGSGAFKYGSTGGAGSWYVDLDSSGLVTRVYKNQEASPYIPCKNCDTEPCCYPNAMTDPSPDEITLNVAWSAASGGCVPAETEFTMARLPRQIIQGFIFGRTFESEKITLPCGGYLKFFLESTPYHWSKYRYRQYLGVETNFGGTKRFAKFNVTMGSALVRNNVTGGANKFTSPSPAGVSFDFPYSDSFSDYASDIVSSGWTDYATVVLEEPFVTDNCSTNSADAACVVADGYIFGTGVDRPERRLGSCGWQMGVSEFALSSTSFSMQNSRYNYRISCGSPTVSNNTRIAPFDTLLHRPFAAVARGLIGTHNEGFEIIEADLPFTDFVATLTPSEFVRPEPFLSINQDSIRQNGPSGCIDCEVSATFSADDATPGIGNPPRTVTTAKISRLRCPQKTLSGAVSSVLSGSQEGDGRPGTGLLRMLGAAEGNHKGLAAGARYPDRSGSSYWQTHLGGTLRANGKTQFTSQIDDFNQGDSGGEFLHFNLKSTGKVNGNSALVFPSSITKGTRVEPYNSYQSPPPSGESLGVTIPVTKREVQKKQPDRGTLGSQNDVDLVPVSGSNQISASNCVPCNKAGFCSSGFIATLANIQYPVTTYSFGLHASSQVCDYTTSPNHLNAVVRNSATPYCGGATSLNNGVPSGNNIVMAMNRDDWSVVEFESCPIGNRISGEAEKLSTPTPFGVLNQGGPVPAGVLQLIERPLVYHYPDYQSCGSNAVFIQFIPTTTTITPRDQDGQECANATFGDIVFSRDDETGIISATVEYSVKYSKRFIFSYVSDYYESYEYDAIYRHGDCTEIFTANQTYPERHLSTSSGPGSFSIFVVENYVATYSASGPKCADSESGIILNYQSSVAVSRSTLATGDPTPAGTETSPGVYSLSGSFSEPSCAMLDPSVAVPSPYDLPEFSAFVQIHPEAIYLKSSTGPGCPEVISNFSGESRLVTSCSPHPSTLPDPDSMAIPVFIDLSGSYISITESDPSGGLDRNVGYPDQYLVDGQVHEIDKYARYSYEDEDYIKVLMPSACLYEVYTISDIGEADSLVARYRVPNFPYSRWSRSGTNQMQLVSADWAIEDWPIYITVEPVAP